MKAYYALDRFRPGSPFRPWLLRIVANEARNRRGPPAAGRAWLLRAAAVSDGDAAPSPETAALAVEDREALVAALNRLPPADRDVIGYRFLLGLSEQETAEVLDVRPGHREVAPGTGDGEAARRWRTPHERAPARDGRRRARSGPWPGSRSPGRTRPTSRPA